MYSHPGYICYLLKLNMSKVSEERLPYSDSSGPRLKKRNDVAAVVASTLTVVFPIVLLSIINAYCDNQEYYEILLEDDLDIHNIPIYMAPLLDNIVSGEKQPIPTLGSHFAPLLTRVMRLRGCWQPSPALLRFFISHGPFPSESRIFQSATNECMQLRCFFVGETIELTVSDGPMFTCPLTAIWHWHSGCPNMYNAATSRKARNNFFDRIPDHELLKYGMRSNVRGVLLENTPYDTLFVHEFTDSPEDIKPYNNGRNGFHGFYEPFRCGVGQVISDQIYSCVIKWVGIIDACFPGTGASPYNTFGETDYFRLVVLSSSVKKR
jgi:hypothetical protein